MLSPGLCWGFQIPQPVQKPSARTSSFVKFIILQSLIVGDRRASSVPGVEMDPTDLGPGTPTWLGVTGTVLLGSSTVIRDISRKKATERAMDSAEIGTSV